MSGHGDLFEVDAGVGVVGVAVCPQAVGGRVGDGRFDGQGEVSGGFVEVVGQFGEPWGFGREVLE
ncbi:hypothetical protein ACFQ3B_20230 [Stackebrandtia endophytica]|uniref:hypothetical protein n=1 Tax=Stackebrandtia endophytica TaxID=1496996 RepID=UPI0036403C5F